MQRRLVPAHPTRGHPIRAIVRQARRDERRRQDDGDLKLFVMSFSAFFVCFYTFLI